MLADLPPAARLLGLAGLLPFWGLALALPILAPDYAAIALAALVGYGAVILAFLGGVHWGVALRPSATPSWARLGWGVAPSLIGWTALLLPPRGGLVLLALGLAAALVVDLRSLGPDLVPRWYAGLRRLLSAGAIAALAVGFVLAPG